MTDELARLDGMAQADLVRRGEATPRELVDAAIVPRCNKTFHWIRLPMKKTGPRTVNSEHHRHQ